MADDDDDEACPLCMNDLDETDLSFFACPCNYQVCLFCVHYIMEQMNGKCPACRTDYSEPGFRYDASCAKAHRDKKAKKKANGKQAGNKPEAEKPKKEEDETALRARHAEQLQQRKARGGKRDLGEMRVVQRNVVHVIGLTPNIAKVEVLKRAEFFGQYGKLTRVAVSKAPTQAKVTSANGIFSAYLTYDKNEDAHVAIQAVDGFAVDGQVLRASFGTTKYCRKWLDGEKCERKDCNFLHQLVEDNGREPRENREPRGKGEKGDKGRGKGEKGEKGDRGKGKGEKGEKGEGSLTEKGKSPKKQKGAGKGDVPPSPPKAEIQADIVEAAPAQNAPASSSRAPNEVSRPAPPPAKHQGPIGAPSNPPTGPPDNPPGRQPPGPPPGGPRSGPPSKPPAGAPGRPAAPPVGPPGGPPSAPPVGPPTGPPVGAPGAPPSGPPGYSVGAPGAPPSGPPGYPAEAASTEPSLNLSFGPPGLGFAPPGLNFGQPGPPPSGPPGSPTANLGLGMSLSCPLPTGPPPQGAPTGPATLPLPAPPSERPPHVVSAPPTTAPSFPPVAPAHPPGMDMGLTGPPGLPSSVPSQPPSQPPRQAPGTQSGGMPHSQAPAHAPSHSPHLGAPSLPPSLPPSQPPLQPPSAPPSRPPTQAAAAPSQPPSMPPSQAPSQAPSQPPSMPPRQAPNSRAPAAPPGASPPPSGPPAGLPGAPPARPPPGIPPSGLDDCALSEPPGGLSSPMGFAPALGSLSPGPPAQAQLSPSGGQFDGSVFSTTPTSAAVFSTSPTNGTQKELFPAQVGTPLSVSDLFGTLKPDKVSDSPPAVAALPVPAPPPLPSSSSPLLQAQDAPSPPPLQAPMINSPLGTSPHEHLLPQPAMTADSPPARRPYEDAYSRPPAYDATRSGYEDLNRGYDQSGYDTTSLGGGYGHHPVFNGGYNPGHYGGAFDALYGSDGLSRHANPYAQASGHLPWMQQLSAMQAAQAAAQDGYGMYGQQSAGAAQAALQLQAAAAAAAASGVAKQRAPHGLTREQLESLAAGPGGASALAGLGGPPDAGGGGVDFLQALFPNTRISVQPPVPPPNVPGPLGLSTGARPRPPGPMGGLSSSLLGTGVPGGLGPHPGLGGGFGAGGPSSLSATIGALGLPQDGLGAPPGMQGGLGVTGFMGGFGAPGVHAGAASTAEARKGQGGPVGAAQNAARNGDRRNPGRGRNKI